MDWLQQKASVLNDKIGEIDENYGLSDKAQAAADAAAEKAGIIDEKYGISHKAGEQIENLLLVPLSP